MSIKTKQKVKTTLTPSEKMQRHDFLIEWAKAACNKAMKAETPVELDSEETLSRLVSIFALSQSNKINPLQAMMPKDIIDMQDTVLKSLGTVKEEDVRYEAPILWLVETYPTALPQ